MELARQVSPITHVRKDLPPIITLMGDKDPITPYAQGMKLHEALDRAGVPNELVTIWGGATARLNLMLGLASNSCRLRKRYSIS